MARCDEMLEVPVSLPTPNAVQFLIAMSCLFLWHGGYVPVDFNFSVQSCACSK